MIFSPKQSGFIQIPILIAVAIGVLVVGGGSYVGISKHQAANGKKISAEIEAKNKIEAQKLALTQVQNEIEKLKQENSSTTETLNEQKQVIKKTQSPVIPIVENPKTIAPSNIPTPTPPIAISVPAITPIATQVVTTPILAPKTVPSPAPTPAVVTPILSIQAVSTAPAQNSVRIDWTTSIAATAKVFYWSDATSKLVEQSSAGLGTIHYVDISNLTPGITYYFTIEAVSMDGKTLTRNGSFSTIGSTISAKKKTIYSTDDWSVTSTGEQFEVKAITISATGLNLREKMYSPGINVFNGASHVSVVFWACEGLDDPAYPCPGTEANTPEALQDSNLTMGFLAESTKTNATWDPLVFKELNLNYPSGAKIEFIKVVGVKSGKVVCLTETSIPVGLVGTADCSANILIPN